MRARSKAKEPSQAKKLEAVAKRFEAFRPARDVMTRVRAVPTRFVQLDHATRVGGWPTERFTLIHGPSNEGKTELALGLEDSFLSLDHFALHLDAERTTPITWFERLSSHADHPRFFALRPESYEQAVADTRTFLNNVAEAREAGEVPPETAAIVVADSLRKFVPKDLMKEILKTDAEADDVKGGKDRGAQLKAKMNAAWMDELIPLLERANASFVAIAREMQDPDADVWAKRFGNDYKVGGGSAIYYDASLVLRVEREGWVSHGEGKDRKTYGERRRITIKKTKIGGKTDRVTRCWIHSSNGEFTPFGFDRARDVLDLAVRFGVVTKSGAWFTYEREDGEGERIAAGEHNAVKLLTETPDWLATIERDVRSRFADVAPQELDEQTGEVT